LSVKISNTQSVGIFVLKITQIHTIVKPGKISEAMHNCHKIYSRGTEYF